MKKVLTTICLLIISTVLFSQVYEGRNAEKYVKGSMIVRFSGNTENPTYIKLNEASQPNYYDMLTWLAATFNIGGNSGFVLLNKETDDIGFEHFRYQQTYNNVPIREAVFLIHVQHGKILSFNGAICSTPSIQNHLALDEKQALNNALAFVNGSEYMWQNKGNEAWLKEFTGKADATYYPKGIEKIIYNAQEKSFRMAYKFDIYATKPLSRQDVYIDAETGKVLLKLNTLCTGNAHGTAVTKYSGTKPITTDSVSTTSYRLRETGRGDGIGTYNMLQGTDYNSSVDFTDADNYWNNVNTQMDEAAGDAHWGAEMTYDYYFIKHGRNSIDNNGLALKSYVHYDVGYDNAFWDGQKMTYGDGSSSNPFTALDICGHEITHGLTTYTANLDAANEPGALNEGFSDIFGTAIEFYGKPASANWTCGEDIGYVIRDLANPNNTQNPDTYLGTYWDAATQEVHKNSTVISHWFYLLCQGGSGTNDIGNAYSVTGIGMTEAADIAYRTLTVYLTSTSTYPDTRFYAILAANDLYGGCTPEVEAVTDAMYAVGIGTAYVAKVVVNFTASNNTSCSAPATVQFVNQSSNATNYIWNFGDGGTSTLSNPSHVYNGLGNYNVKLIGQSTGCGSDSLTQNAFVSIATNNSNYASIPANETGTALNCCTGTLFDSGGTGDYSDNTDGTITIAPTGAALVMLTFTSFNFESGYDYLYIYNGPTTASPLIGQYDGTSLPNGGVIQSTGGAITLRQTTDAGVTASGFQLTWQCSIPSSPPQSNFYASETSTCTGVIHFNDMTVNGPASWLWNFGDGSTSTLQNPVHGYQANGVYTVKLKTSNAFGTDSTIKISYININNLPALPSVTPGIACDSNPVTLSANGSGQLNWYDALTGGTLLHTGSPFVTPDLYTTTTYYVEDKILSPSQYVGKTDNSGSGSNYNNAGNVHYEIFNCYSPLTLVSVKVYASGAANRTIQLRDTNQTVLQSASINIPDGQSRITLNFPLPVQNSLQLTCTGTPNLFRNNQSSVTYPFTLAGLLKITESSASKPPYNALGNYYYFYDWEVKEPECTSPRVPVVATINQCNGIGEIDADAYFAIFPNPATDDLFVDFSSKKPQEYTLTLLDVIGKTIYSSSNMAVSGTNHNKISLYNVKPGVYFINLVSSSLNRTEKVVVK
jgi:Zn-dependent metalloprotease